MRNETIFSVLILALLFTLVLINISMKTRERAMSDISTEIRVERKKVNVKMKGSYIRGEMPFSPTLITINLEGTREKLNVLSGNLKIVNYITYGERNKHVLVYGPNWWKALLYAILTNKSASEKLAEQTVGLPFNYMIEDAKINRLNRSNPQSRVFWGYMTLLYRVNVTDKRAEWINAQEINYSSTISGKNIKFNLEISDANLLTYISSSRVELNIEKLKLFTPEPSIIYLETPENSYILKSQPIDLLLKVFRGNKLTVLFSPRVDLSYSFLIDKNMSQPPLLGESFIFLLTVDVVVLAIFYIARKRGVFR